LPDSRETHERWRALLVQHSIHGVQVHDPAKFQTRLLTTNLS
jgi:hypothetical protein